MGGAQSAPCIVRMPNTRLPATCAVQDALELLEKRVKSRFSHRQIHVFNSMSFGNYCDVCRDLLLLPDSDAGALAWNAHVAELMAAAPVLGIHRSLYETSKDIRALHSLLLPVVCALGPTRPRIMAMDLQAANDARQADQKVQMLLGLSTLELCLIVATKRLLAKRESPSLMPSTAGHSVNFEMIYEEYARFTERSEQHSVARFSKPVALKAFEHLLALELLLPCEPGSIAAPREFRAVRLAVEHAQVDDAVARFVGCATAVQIWAAEAPA